MKVVLPDGHEVDWLGPVTTTMVDGKIHIDFTNYWARDENGQILTIPEEVAQLAKFPDEVEKAAEEAFDASLDDVVDNWRKLCKRFYSNS